VQRLARISSLKGVRYWSKSKKQWQTFIEDASALSAPERGARRSDFSPQEIRGGARVHFLQRDNTAGDVIYRMQIHEASADRLVVGMDNAGTVKKFLMTILHPNDAQMLYFFDRESDDVWQLYSITRISDRASSLASGKPASSINRAMAVYRHLAGIPTDQNPPAAK
jgi:hypothetical protein